MNIGQIILDAIPGALANIWSWAVAAFAANPWPFLLVGMMVLLSGTVPARRRRRRTHY